MMPVFRKDLLLVTVIVPLFVTLPVTVLPVIKMPTFDFCCAVALIEPALVTLPVTVLLLTPTPTASRPVAEIVELLTMSPVIVEFETRIPSAELAADVAVIVPEFVIAACVPPATVD
ncbi:MAG: hypothetical protein JO357_09520 [Hyphomicrobiales bacterium]|nr:hypothetical protein [Hyphomicrobiales bacterium]